jgi:hypothetical protein
VPCAVTWKVFIAPMRTWPSRRAPWYFLLPEDLQFKNLDYLNSSFAAVRDRWEAHSFVDLLPTVAVLAGGGLVKGVLGGLSAKHAGKIARRNIEQGRVTFEPNLFLLPHGPMMMGMGLRY